MDNESDQDFFNLLLLAAAVNAYRRKKKRTILIKKRFQNRNQYAGRRGLALLPNELRLGNTCSVNNYLRMNEKCFYILLNKIKGRISRSGTILRQCIPARNRLAATLRFLATGETYQSLSYNFRISKSTLSQIIPEVLDALYDTLFQECQMPYTEEAWHLIEKDFREKWNFPNCCGAMDAKHITFRPAKQDRNCKGTDSVVLLAIVDANYRFLGVDIADGGVFKNSFFSTDLEINALNMPESVNLPNSNIKTPFVLVANDAFPLTEHILKSFRYHGLNHEQKIYNYRLSRAQRVVENTFGILTNRFRILLNPIPLEANLVEKIALVCCLLHNFLGVSNKSKNDIYFSKTPQQNALPSLQEKPANRTRQSAVTSRNNFVDYFNGPGAVDWQEAYINK